MMVKGSFYVKPLPVALFCGVGKPNFLEFLANLSSELGALRCGVVLQNMYVRASKITFLCDAPARSYVQFIKGHSAFYGCGYCRQKGERFLDRTIFPQIGYELRTDNAYNAVQENNQTAASPLLGSVPFYSNFPPDPMHLLYLGVTKKLFHYYFATSKGLRLPCKLPNSSISSLSKDICSIIPFFPAEFNRSVRSLDEMEHYKAVEYRNFLLYAGPFLFKKYLPIDYFNHFLLLHFSAYVLSSPIFSKSLLPQAKACINLFVSRCETLFGRQSLIYNVHTLSHLPDFVQSYGTLESFSCFAFESYLSIVKRRLKSSRNIFKHSVNTLINIREIFSTIPPATDMQYSSDTPNNCAILRDGHVLLIDHCFPDGSVSGDLLIFKNDLYLYPYPSHHVNIGVFTRSLCRSSGFPVRKCIFFPRGCDYVIFPFVSSELFVK
jgi:hypothetical protein